MNIRYMICEPLSVCDEPGDLSPSAKYFPDSLWSWKSSKTVSEDMMLCMICAPIICGHHP